MNLKDVRNIDMERTSYGIDPDGIPVADVFLAKTDQKCPECGSKDVSIRGSKVTKLRHVDACGSPIRIMVHRRQYSCRECGRSFKEDPVGLSRGRTITAATKARVLELLRNPAVSYKDAASIAGVSVTTVQRIFDKCVPAKRGKLGEIVSIDDLHTVGLTKTHYSTVVMDPQRGTLVDIYPSRRKKDLEEELYAIPVSERLGVKYLTMDLSETYQSVGKKLFPNAVIALDSFHVIENLGRAFERIRIGVMKRYEDSKEEYGSPYWMLKRFARLLVSDPRQAGTRYEFRKGGYSLTRSEIVDRMLSIDDGLKEAWDLKESYRTFNRTTKSKAEAEAGIGKQIDAFLKAKTDEMREFGALLLRNREGICNSFIRVGEWRLSNGKMERMNEAIRHVFEAGYGYANFPRTRARLLYVMNGGEPMLNDDKKLDNCRETKRGAKHKKARQE